ncbi:MAG: cytochrome P450 [Litoreibacter sp.]
MKGPSTRFLGLDTLIKIRRDQLGFYKDMQARYGDTVPLRLGPYRSWLLFHPDQIEVVLASKADQFIRFERMMKVLRQWNGESLFIAEGQSWHDRRRKVLPAFAQRKMPVYEAIFQQVAKDWVTHLSNQADRSGAVHLDADDIFAQIALDIALRTLFGGGFTEGMDQVSVHIKVLSEVAFRECASPLTLPDYLPLRGKRKKKAAMAFMRNLVRDLVEERLNGPEGDDLLQVLIETHEGDEQEICDDAMSLLIAGHETSGAALAWIFALLADHPEALSRCQAEVSQFDDVGEMIYLQAVIEEALRMYPPGYTLFLRQAKTDLDVAGVTVRKGELLQILPYMTGRDPRFFLEPDRFNPDRFMNAPTWPFFANIPFSAGPRACTGHKFALKEVSIVTAELLRGFHPRLKGSFPTPEPKFSLRPEGGLPMIWENR